MRNGILFLYFPFSDLKSTKGLDPHGVELSVPVNIVDEVLLGE